MTKTLDAAKVLQLEMIPGEENEQTMELEESLTWLRTTIDTCIKMADKHQRQPNESCAEGMVQLRFPTGLTVIGGFARNDQLRDVLSFACCFYHADKSPCVRLRQSHNAKAGMDEQDLDKTLVGYQPRFTHPISTSLLSRFLPFIPISLCCHSFLSSSAVTHSYPIAHSYPIPHTLYVQIELGLFPRSTLMVDTQDERERSVSVSQTHAKVVTEVKQQKIHAEQLRKAKISAQGD